MKYVHNLSDGHERSSENIKQRRRVSSVQGRDEGDKTGTVQVLVQRHEE